MKRKYIYSAVTVMILAAALFTWKNSFGGSGRPVSAGELQSMTQSQAVAAAAEGNWGLSFQQDGKPPVANAAAEYLRQFDAWYTGTETGGKLGSCSKSGECSTRTAEKALRRYRCSLQRTTDTCHDAGMLSADPAGAKPDGGCI